MGDTRISVLAGLCAGIAEILVGQIFLCECNYSIEGTEVDGFFLGVLFLNGRSPI